MKYRVDLYFSGTITQFIEANGRHSAYKKAEQNIENISHQDNAGSADAGKQDQ